MAFIHQTFQKLETGNFTRDVLKILVKDLRTCSEVDVSESVWLYFDFYTDIFLQVF